MCDEPAKGTVRYAAPWRLTLHEHLIACITLRHPDFRFVEVCDIVVRQPDFLITQRQRNGLWLFSRRSIHMFDGGIRQLAGALFKHFRDKVAHMRTEFVLDRFQELPGGQEVIF
jgi:hypothetical protein